MRVELKAVGWVERILKTDQQDFCFDGETVSDLLSAIEERFGESIRKGRILVLVNGNGAQSPHRLKDGDAVTLLPVMSGG